MSYGVQPTGFARKSLQQILSDVEAKAIDVLGPQIIQTAQSPMGQINGLFADLTSDLWALAEHVYQSYDPDQAEASRLDILGRLRLVDRAGNENDDDYRAAITNEGRARVDTADIVRAIAGIPGVTWVRVYVNDGDASDANGITSHSVCVAVLGGDDDEIARTVRAYVVPGVGTYGNTRVDTNIDGFCRSLLILRPAVVPIWLTVSVTVSPDANGCPAPTPAAMATGLAQALSGELRPANGDDVDLHMVSVPMARLYPNVRVVSAIGGLAEAGQSALPLSISFAQIPTFAPERIDVTIL